MKEFIIANANTIILCALLVAVLLVAAYLAIKLGYRKKVAQIAYNFVVYAEEHIKGTKRGQERKAQVIEWLHDAIPAPFQFFITEDDINTITENAVKKMKAALAEAANE